jgi:hypothetical protein
MFFTWRCLAPSGVSGVSGVSGGLGRQQPPARPERQISTRFAILYRLPEYQIIIFALNHKFILSFKSLVDCYRCIPMT